MVPNDVVGIRCRSAAMEYLWHLEILSSDGVTGISVICRMISEDQKSGCLPVAVTCNSYLPNKRLGMLI